MVLNRAMGDGKNPLSWPQRVLRWGCLVWGAIVSLGLGAMLQASGIAYNKVQYAGVLYLLWLGVGLLLKPGMINPSSTLQAHMEYDQNLIRGFTTNIQNPKVSVPS